jgi:hypothetical protein
MFARGWPVPTKGIIKSFPLCAVFVPPVSCRASQSAAVLTSAERSVFFAGLTFIPNLLGRVPLAARGEGLLNVGYDGRLRFFGNFSEALRGSKDDLLVEVEELSDVV